MAAYPFTIVSTILAVPSSAHSVLQLYKHFKPGDGDGHEQARKSMLESLETRCREAEERARRDIRCQHQKDQILRQFLRLKKLIAEARNGQLQITEPIEWLCDVVEDALHQVILAQATSATPSQANEGEIAAIKDKMLKDRPLAPAKYSHIFCNTDTPPGIDFDRVGSIECFAMLADELCFMEYFPFGADNQKTKSRISWMMLLLRELQCPRLLQPVKVFAISEISQPGFYTFSRVPSSQHAGVGRVCTLAECVSRVRNKKLVLVQLSEAVEGIHAQTILHKNICAHNVILDEADNTWLAGFSSSRLGDQDSYKIPEEEQSRMKMVYYDTDDPSHHVRTFKCDIYALGVTLLEVLVGTSFVKNTELIKSRAQINRLLCEDCKPGELNKLICDCLNPEARSRPHAFEIRSKVEFMDSRDIDDFVHPTLQIQVA